jgi:hypothetical protein
MTSAAPITIVLIFYKIKSLLKGRPFICYAGAYETIIESLLSLGLSLSRGARLKTVQRARAKRMLK